MYICNNKRKMSLEEKIYHYNTVIGPNFNSFDGGFVKYKNVYFNVICVRYREVSEYTVHYSEDFIRRCIDISILDSSYIFYNKPEISKSLNEMFENVYLDNIKKQRVIKINKLLK